MGKNRKPKQEMNHGLHYSGSEDELYSIEAPEDFLTSDDFCVVKNKRNCKKCRNDVEDSTHLTRSRSNSGKTSTFGFPAKDSGETNRCYTSFWTNKYQEGLFRNSQHTPNLSSRDGRDTSIADGENSAISDCVKTRPSESKSNSETNTSTNADQESAEVKSFCPPEAFAVKQNYDFNSVSLGFGASANGFQLLVSDESEEDKIVNEIRVSQVSVVNSTASIERSMSAVCESANNTTKRTKKNKRKKLPSSNDEVEQLLKELGLLEGKDTCNQVESLESVKVDPSDCGVKSTVILLPHNIKENKKCKKEARKLLGIAGNI